VTSIAWPAPPARGRARAAAVLLGGGALAGVLAGTLVTGGRPLLVLVLAAALLPVVLWKHPALGPALLVGAALTIEQFPESVGTRALGATARIPFFHGLGGFRPSDLLLGLVLAIAVAKSGTATVAELPRSPLAKTVYVLQAAVLFAFVLGLATGGSLAVAMNETRPYVYLGIAFLVTATVVDSRRAVRLVLWVLVLGTGFKAVQGLALFLSVRSGMPRPDAVLGHEESLFFAIFVLLTLSLWLYGLAGPLRTTATVLLPVVVAADLGNSRRIAWLLLLFAVVTAIAVGLVQLRSRRRFLVWLAVGAVVAASLYLPAYWNKTGGFAQPARAVRTIVSPGGQRDLSSNLYRIQEDANLRYNIQRAGPLGKGFGHRIDYALPIVDISDIDPYIAYVPHNGIWYLFLRLGVVGTIAFWSLLGVGIVAACRLARCREKELAVVGMVLACALPAYAVLGYGDQGFFYYRVAFVIGVLLGLAEAARRLTEAQEGAAA
jgi:hypothetical protein